jgi:hypothetical protein
MLKRRNAKKLPERIPKNAKNLPVSPPSSNFPSDILKWMKENSKPKTALKLMQICKYFQHPEFPYFVMRQLQGSVSYGWRYQPLLFEIYENLDFESCQNKLWITEELHIFDNHKSKMLLSLLPKIAVCDVLILHLIVNNITFEQFKLLTAAGNVLELLLQETIIKNENDEIIPLENIFDDLPNLHKLALSRSTNSFYSHEHATSKIPSNLQTLQLHNISETFNLEECFKFIQFNQQIHFYIHHFENRLLSKRLQTCTDILLQSWSPENPRPNISFKKQTTESREKLKELEKLYKKKFRKDDNERK